MSYNATVARENASVEISVQPFREMMTCEQSNLNGPQDEGTAAPLCGANLFWTAARITDLWWPAFVAILLTGWTAARATDSSKWWDVALMCGPQALLHAAVEGVRQRRAL